MLDKKLLEEAKTSKILLFITIGVGLVISVLVVLQASYLARIVSGVFLKGQDLNSVWPFLSTLLLIIIIKAFLVWLEEIMASLAAAQIKKSLRQRLLAHLFSLGPTFVRGEQTGSLVNLLTEGIQTLENYFARYLPQLARVVLIPLLILIFIFPQDLLSGLILLFTAPLIPIFMILILPMFYRD